MTGHTTRANLELHEAHARASRFAAFGAAEPGAATVLQVEGLALPSLPRIDAWRFNLVTGLGLERPASGTTVDAIVAAYLALGQTRFAISVAEGAEPASLADSLRQRGFVASATSVKLVHDLDAQVAHTPGDLRVEPVGEDEAALFGAVSAKAFEVPAGFADWFACTVGTIGWSHYLAFVRDTAVGAATLFVRDGLAWLANAAVAPAWRRHGVHRALLERRLEVAQRSGCVVAHSVVDREPSGSWGGSARNMFRLGFVPAYTRTTYIRSPNAGAEAA